MFLLCNYTNPCSNSLFDTVFSIWFCSYFILQATKRHLSRRLESLDWKVEEQKETSQLIAKNVIEHYFCFELSAIHRGSGYWIPLEGQMPFFQESFEIHKLHFEEIFKLWSLPLQPLKYFSYLYFSLSYIPFPLLFCCYRW